MTPEAQKAVDLADDLLAQIPEWQTRKREIVESIGEQARTKGWVSAAQLSVLENVAADLPADPVATHGLPSKQARSTRSTCGRCGGTGTIQGGEDTCPMCGGTGALITIRPPAPAPTPALVAEANGPKILVSAALVDHGSQKLKDAVRLQKALAPGANVVSSEEVPWQAVMQNEGGWRQAYEWASKRYDAIVLVETDVGGLGRSQFDLAKLFLGLGKKVGVFTGGDRIARVQDVRKSGENDWRQNFGTVLLAP